MVLRGNPLLRLRTKGPSLRCEETILRRVYGWMWGKGGQPFGVAIPSDSAASLLMSSRVGEACEGPGYLAQRGECHGALVGMKEE